MMGKSDRNPLFSVTLPALAGGLALVALVGGFGAWAASARIDGAVIAPGRIVVDRNRQAVQHLDGGMVAEVLVKEGDRIEAGALLVRLDPTLALSELAITESRLYELMARRGRMEAERDDAGAVVFDPDLLAAASAPEVARLVEGQRGLFEARQDSLSKAVTQLENQQLQLQNQIGGIDAQMVALDRQLDLVGQEAAVQQGLLDRGLAQSSRVLNLQREEARLAGLRGELVARRAEAMERIAEIGIELLQLQTQRREEAITTLRDLEISEMETRERRAALKTQLDRMLIRAPVAGVAYDLRLFGAQSVVRPADPLLYIVPQDRPLVIEAQVDPIDVTRVHPGQQVVVRVQAFDMRNTPDLLGQVMLVSPDAFTDATTGRPYYRVEVELPKTELSKLTPDQVLIPGMPVDSFIRTGEHTPLAYLTAPLTRYLDRAMRDDS
ncbi:HlyD family type I secretion periplasmic adaptor subunit [Salipiger marinus]|jgi:HlyD family secretion protein|uniref:HlyD family type I secretion periplasmic adaptor subunit n=1 Tax=Salipiger marinus TaxID=555512 RepID=UPI000E98AFCF|nr:HlyD family type I secretion periplasmic adaptor subunit [Salipiger manganoxidans]MCD1618864.1 HlyD family type I secretion periplasmic adaptor subunit [Salipiger manganoxidans]MEB3419775.1 HlyD family type I secretion periplasmic adaptor subunit [Salipiger manganoxidans]HBM57918.1 HlyD family type I secretion periplasmic adaptor subunit [Citreicella sp.]